MNADPQLHLKLRDGTPVLVRPLVPEDRAALAEAYRRLSPEARYHRFWTRTDGAVSGRLLDRVLAIDPTTHSSWAVLDMTREFPGMGAASWWRDTVLRNEAEFSVTILDSEQGRGIGTLLLAIMWLDASKQGIDVLKGYAMPANRQASAWMQACGASGKYDGDHFVFRWDLSKRSGFPDTRASRELEAWLQQLGPEF